MRADLKSIQRLGALCALLLGGCPSSPSAKDQLSVACTMDEDCARLDQSYGGHFVCEADAGLCVRSAGLPDAGDGGQVDAGDTDGGLIDGGMRCTPACSTGERCTTGGCVSDPLRVHIERPEDGRVLAQKDFNVSASVRGGVGVPAVTCTITFIETHAQRSISATLDTSSQRWLCGLKLFASDGAYALVVEASDRDGATAQDQLGLILDLTRPQVALSLSQDGSLLSPGAFFWPTDLVPHSKITISVEINDANVNPSGISYQVKRSDSSNLQIPSPGAGTCQSMGSGALSCTLKVPIVPADFDDTNRGKLNFFVRVQDLAGNARSAMTRLLVDDTAPRLDPPSCDHELDLPWVRDDTVTCSLQASDQETALSGSPLVRWAGLPDSGWSLSPVSLGNWSLSLKLKQLAHPSFEASYPWSIQIADVWGNLATRDENNSVTRLRWTRSFSNLLRGSLAVATTPGGEQQVFMAFDDTQGKQVHMKTAELLGGAARLQLRSNRPQTQTAIGVIAGPVLRSISSNELVAYLLSDIGVIYTVHLQTGGPTASVLDAYQDPLGLAGTSYASLPVFSSDGSQGFVLRSRGLAAGGQAAWVEPFDGGGDASLCARSPALFEMGPSSLAAVTDRSSGATQLLASDQLGHALFAVCLSCNCGSSDALSISTGISGAAPQRSGALTAYQGGFLYPERSGGGPDSLAFVETDTTSLPPSLAWLDGAFNIMTLWAGPVHDQQIVSIGGQASMQYPDQLQTISLSQPSILSSSQGGDAVVDLIREADGGDYRLLYASAQGLRLARISATGGETWSMPLMSSAPPQGIPPPIDFRRMVLTPTAGGRLPTLLLIDGNSVRALVVDHRPAPGWPMARRDPTRSGWLP